MKRITIMQNNTYDIYDQSLAGKGEARIEWSAHEMPVLRQLRERLRKDSPLKGITVSGCLHITTETANLALTLKAAGADLVLCASNPLSTQDDVAAALVERFNIPVFAIRGESTRQYYQHINAALDHKPQLTMDDGADLVSEIHQKRSDLIAHMFGGTEETTTGVIRLRAMAKDGQLHFPVIAVNDAMTKHLFDNRYGTGQSTLDGVIRATNILLAGKNFCIVGYGWCGRGIAMRARGHGAHVIICEVDAVRALEATMDGYRVMPLSEAARQADFIITATGDRHVVDRQHLELMKDGCILANSGHFNVEINIPALEEMSIASHSPRQFVDEYTLSDGRKLRLLAQGRLVNLAAAEGHPSAVMDMSFANQALSLVYLASHHRQLDNTVHNVPLDIDEEISRLKLAAMNIKIDRLTDEQQHYLSSWQEGTV